MIGEILYETRDGKPIMACANCDQEIVERAVIPGTFIHEVTLRMGCDKRGYMAEPKRSTVDEIEHAPGCCVRTLTCGALQRLLAKRISDDFAQSSEARPGVGAAVESCTADEKATVEELQEALREAVELIRIFHGEAGWEIYRTHAPEMLRLEKLLASGVE